jgi:vacuolar-type H+-ATPase subunit H
MNAVASLTASLKSIQDRPPLPLHARSQNVKTNTPIALQKKRSRQIVHEVENVEDEIFEDFEEDNQKRIRHSDRRLVEYANSVEDTVMAEFQKTEETLERCRRDNRLNAILLKLRYMKGNY